VENLSETIPAHIKILLNLDQNLQEHVEEEISPTNSDEEDNYGVDALELLLQKLKPNKTVPVMRPPPPRLRPCPPLNWKIELPNLQAEETSPQEETSQPEETLEPEEIAETEEISQAEEMHEVVGHLLLNKKEKQLSSFM
jgi:hypothetical protein